MIRRLFNAALVMSLLLWLENKRGRSIKGAGSH
jgi:hypothetical protein